MTQTTIVWALLRMTMGWMFFWAFLDKIWGLGFATTAGNGWLNGVSPTNGFLSHATKGPFVSLFQAMAGNPVVDWLFMLGLLGIGVALMLGIGVRIAGYSGIAMMILMFLALLPPTNNPIIDEHIIYALVFALFTQLPVGDTWGLGEFWKSTDIVKRYPFLA
ncbi:MAG: hypothetical protein AAB701_03120 [Patescibacteria group bacterium]